MEQTPRLVLVMDDEIKVTELRRVVLEADGHAVVVASHGQSAVGEIVARRPDLVRRLCATHGPRMG